MDGRTEHDSGGVKVPEATFPEHAHPQREWDLVVKMPPKRVRAVKVRIVRRTKGTPNPVIYRAED